MSKTLCLIVAGVLCVIRPLAGRECQMLPSGGFALNGTGISAEARLFLPGWQERSPAIEISPEGMGVPSFSFGAGAAKILGRSVFVARRDGCIAARWSLTSDHSVDLEQLYVGFSFESADTLRSYVTNGKRHSIPTVGTKFQFGQEMVQALTLCGADDKELVTVRFEKPHRIVFQDNARYGGKLELRVVHPEKTIAPGAFRTFEMVLSASDGMELIKPKPTVVTAGRDWLPFEEAPNIVSGSALDFSTQSGVDAPAGKHGRVISRNGHFEFEHKPGVPQRFYGFNLCFGANYHNTKDEADRFVERVVRLGYNAVRLHHHDGLLVGGMKDSVSINPERMKELDALVSACFERGLYVTTDLYVSRDVPWREVGVDRPGNVEMGTYKEIVRTNELAFANLCAFAKNWLTHVNEFTGRRWADEPGVAWISFVNENCPDNMQVLDAEQISAAQEREERFVARLTKFLREEVGSKQLFTDLNGWSQSTHWRECRKDFDYVDTHFYVDHPHFLVKPWQLPSSCQNTNPLRGPSPAGVAACGNVRLEGKPFVVSEWNYSGPGNYRGVGGIVTGAWAAYEGWDGLWRFAWSHSHAGVADPCHQSMTYFDVCADPLLMASERATVCLFLRKDLSEGDAKGLSIDGATGRLLINTPRTCGGFAEDGVVNAGVLRAEVGAKPSTVWVSSLDFKPLRDSRHMLFCHLTDVQDSGVRYADKAMKVLLSWGRLPHLMRAGRAEVVLAVADGAFDVFVLNEDGSRRERVPAVYRDGGLSFTADVGRTPGRAAYVYEIVVAR